MAQGHVFCCVLLPLLHRCGKARAVIPSSSSASFLCVRKRPRKNRGLFAKFFASGINFNDLFLVVGTACLADLVRYHQRTAFAALDQCRIAHLPVCSAAVSSCLRGLILGTNRHMIHLLRSQSRPRMKSSPEIVLFDYSQSLPACQLFFSVFSGKFLRPVPVCIFSVFC